MYITCRGHGQRLDVCLTFHFSRGIILTMHSLKQNKRGIVCTALRRLGWAYPQMSPHAYSGTMVISLTILRSMLPLFIT